jgi:1,4-alpha-glucan branching enzyme
MFKVFRNCLVGLLLVVIGFGLGGCITDTFWDSIKDRYKPYEFVGVDGDKVLVKFTFDAPSATDVWLSGTFNNWCASASSPKYPDVPLANNVLVKMKQDPKSKYWITTLPLATGRYLYKYVLDAGRVWEQDQNTDTVDDGFGGKNSVIIVISK